MYQMGLNWDVLNGTLFGINQIGLYRDVSNGTLIGMY